MPLVCANRNVMRVPLLPRTGADTASSVANDGTPPRQVWSLLLWAASLSGLSPLVAAHMSHPQENTPCRGYAKFYQVPARLCREHLQSVFKVTEKLKWKRNCVSTSLCTLMLLRSEEFHISHTVLCHPHSHHISHRESLHLPVLHLWYSGVTSLIQCGCIWYNVTMPLIQCYHF